MATIIVYCNEGAEVSHKKVEEIVVNLHDGVMSFTGVMDDQGPTLTRYPLKSFFTMTVVGLLKITFEGDEKP